MPKILIDNRNFAWNIETIDGVEIITAIDLLHQPVPTRLTSRFQMFLPLEIVDMILTFHIDHLIQSAKLEQAFKIICLSRNIINKYFKKYCNVPITEDSLKIRPYCLYWVFQFASAIFEDTMMKQNTMKSETFYFELSTDWRFEDINFTPYKIFNKFYFNIMELGDFDRIISTPQDLLAICQGERYNDIIWFNGEFDESIESVFHYTSMERPVIVLNICDVDLTLMKRKQMKKTPGWKEFVRLLHHTGGKNTAVYVCDHCSAEGEFVLKKLIHQ